MPATNGPCKQLSALGNGRFPLAKHSRTATNNSSTVLLTDLAPEQRSMRAHGVAPSPSPPSGRSPTPVLASAPARTEIDASRAPAATTTASPSPLQSQRRPTNTVLVIHSLPPRAFALVWWLLLAARVTCALFLLAMSRVYTGLTEECMAYYANLLSPSAPTLFPLISWICIIVTAGHWYAITKMLVVSLRARVLLFSNHSTAAVETTPPTTTRSNHVAPYSSATATLRTITRHRLPLLRKWTLADVYTAIFGQQGFFDAESAFFEGQFLLRESVEMASQTSQVMQGSLLIGRPWINNTLVGVLFVNSWSTPVIQHFARRRPALERVLCLASDFALDASMNIALPTLLLMPYYHKYDTANCTFDAAVLYSDVGMINLVMESRMVLVRGSIDLALKIVPHVSMFMCLRSIQSLLRPQWRRSNGAKEATTAPTASQAPTTPPSVSLAATNESTLTLSRENDQSGPRADLLCPATGATKTPRRGSTPPGGIDRRIAFARSLTMRIRHMQSRRLRGCKATIVHAVFLLWGALICGIHVRTAFQANVASEGTPPGCVQPLRPWFATLPACSVFRYSYLDDNTTSPLEESLAAIDAMSLASLILFDCAQLQMSPMLQSFPNLMEFEIWRSHIVQWDQDAALTATVNPNLVYCGLIQTTMDEIPAGLRYDLPPSLQDIEISNCNLTTLPDDLDIAWANVGTLYIEHCDLREFPEAVKRMAIDDLSFMGNEITELPVSLVPDNVFSLALSGNPTAKISNDTFPDGGQLTFLALEDTLLQDFPSWVEGITERADAKVFVHDTPFCASKSPEEIKRSFGAGAGVTCVDSNLRSTGRYPLDLVNALRNGDDNG